MRGRSTALWVTGFTLLGLCVILSRAFDGQVLAGREVFRIFIPYSLLLERALADGELPLWNHWMRLGQPFLGDLHAQVLYPPRLLALLIAGPHASLTVLQFFHCLVAAAGGTILLRTLRASRLSAFTGGIAWGLSPVLVNLGAQYNVLSSAAWAGFLLSAIAAAAARPTAARIAASALFGALALLGGSPETFLWLGFLAVLIAWHEGRDLRARFAPVSLAMLGAVALSACVFLPVAEFALHSSHAATPEENLRWSLSWHQLLAMIVPGAELPVAEVWGDDQYFLPSVFLGVSVFLLAVAGIAPWRRSWPFALGALVLTALALGRHFGPAAFILDVPPFSAFRYPSKYLVGSAFCFAMLAGLGIDRLRVLAFRSRSLKGLAVAVAGVLGLAFALHLLAAEGVLRSGVRTGSSWTALVCLCAIAAFFAQPRNATRPKRVALSFAVLVLLELTVSSAFRGDFAFVPLTALRKPHPLASTIPSAYMGRVSVNPESPDSDVSPQFDPDLVGRAVLEARGRLAPNVFIDEGMRGLEGYVAPEPSYAAALIHSRNRALYDLLGVRYYFWNEAPMPGLVSLSSTGNEFTLYESPSARPRASLFQHVEVASREEILELLEIAPDKLLETAFVEVGESLRSSPCEGRVELRKESFTHLEFEVVACSESQLVVADFAYPGWSATVDGEERPVLRTNGYLRSLRLSEGRHRVAFTYAPRSVLLGAILSALTLLGCLWALFRGERRT